MPLLFILAVAVLSALLLFYYPLWRKRRILSRPFPQPWLATVKSRLPFFDRLRREEQQQMLDLIQLFLAAKTFYGCGGLEISDEIRVTIAAEACLLLLNRSTGIYPELHYILVYPDAFVARHDKQHPDGTSSSEIHGLLGESWEQGKVILSWDDVVKGASDFHDGHNVVLHEFSHQLDSESGNTNGAPLMPLQSLRTWSRVFTHEFEQLNAAAAHHHRAVMDYYGATNPAEFFAVATETFFEKPHQLQERHPDLYRELGSYYRVDPRQWQ